MSAFHDFSLTERQDSDVLEIDDPPPVGALSLWSWELVTRMERYVSVDEAGRLKLWASERSAVGELVPTTLRFEPVRFHANVPHGPLEGLVVRRVA